MRVYIFVTFCVTNSMAMGTIYLKAKNGGTRGIVGIVTVFRIHPLRTENVKTHRHPFLEVI